MRSQREPAPEPPLPRRIQVRVPGRWHVGCGAGEVVDVRWRPTGRGGASAHRTPAARADPATATRSPAARTCAGVEVVDVSRDGDAYPALHRAQLLLPWGRITAFTGPADSGVSTLLALMATRVAPHAGDLFVAGHHTMHATGRARTAMGWVPSDPVGWGRLRVREALEVMAAAHGVDTQTSRGRVEDLLAVTGLLPRATSPCIDLSVPQRRLLTLAGALVHGPRVVVLDEPLAGLDPAERADLVDLLRELARRGMTLAMGAGETDDVHVVADRVVELEAGRLVASHDLSGEPRPVRRRIVSDDGAALRAGLTRLGVEHETIGGDPLDDAPEGEVVAPVSAIVEVSLAQDRDAADLLAALVQAGVPVHAFLPPQQHIHADAWPGPPDAGSGS